MHIREAAIDAVVVEGEFFMVDAEEVQDGGVEVVDGDGVFAGEVAGFVGCAVAEAGFYTAAREEDGEGVRMMIAVA